MKMRIDTRPLFVGFGSILSMDILKLVFEHQQVVNFWLQTTIGVLTAAYMVKQLFKKTKN